MKEFNKLPYELSELPVSFMMFLEKAILLKQQETPNLKKGNRRGRVSSARALRGR
jgi:hypothetical protein